MNGYSIVMTIGVCAGFTLVIHLTAQLTIRHYFENKKIREQTVIKKLEKIYKKEKISYR